MTPGAVGHYAAGELVDDLHLAVLGIDQVLLVAHVTVGRGQGERNQFLAAAAALPEAAGALLLADLVELVLPARGEVDAAAGPLDDEIPVDLQVLGELR